MNEERMWEQSANWKHARKFAALCHKHWQEHLKPLEGKERAQRYRQRDDEERTYAREAIAIAIATKREKYIAHWAKIMVRFNWEAGTGDISRYLGLPLSSVHGSMSNLIKYGVVVAEGKRPILWKWIGDRKL